VYRCRAGVVVGAGVGQYRGDGAGSVFGQARPYRDLVHFLVIQGLDIERGDEGFPDPLGSAGHHGGDGGELVEQGGVVVLGSGGVLEGG